MGDKGYYDENGWFFFFDRKSNMIKRSGENISTTEIEGILCLLYTSTKLFSLSEVVTAIKHPGVIWACLAYFFVYLVYMGVTYTTPFMTTCFCLLYTSRCV